jgi:hypothetical protein
MGLYQQNIFPRSLFLCHGNHFMRDRMSEKDNQLRIANQSVKVAFRLGENLCFAPVFFADGLVMTHHTVVSADNNHLHTPFLSRKRRATLRRTERHEAFALFIPYSFFDA